MNRFNNLIMVLIIMISSIAPIANINIVDNTVFNQIIGADGIRKEKAFSVIFTNNKEIKSVVQWTL